MKLTERVNVRQHIITLSGCGNCHVLTLSANKRSASNSRSLLASLTFRAGTPFFLTNPVQQHTGTKTLLLVETLSPINGELGPLSPVLVVAPVLWVATLPDYFLPHRWNHAHILTRSRWSWQSRVSMKINFTNGFNWSISTSLIYYPWHTWHMCLERASRFEKKDGLYWFGHMIIKNPEYQNWVVRGLWENWFWQNASPKKVARNG